jgi:RimJ/RimL family protein N-acetyltransferase
MAYEGRQRKHLKKDDEFIDLELYGILYEDWKKND